MEFENKGASRAVAGTALGIGIGALGLEVLRGGLGGVLGNVAGGDCHGITRFEAAQAARIAELESAIKLRDANTYTDSKLLEIYRYVDGKFNTVEGQICAQNVVNAQVTANIACMQNNIASLMSLTKTIIPIDSICPTPATATA